MYDITTKARNYVLANGPQDPLFIQYFGNNSDYPAVLGAYDGILQSNKIGVKFRCDNIDGK